MEKDRIQQILDKVDSDREHMTKDVNIVKNFLIIDTGSGLLAVQIEYLREVLDLRDELDIVLVPFTPKYIKGIINIRDEVIPVLYLSKILGQASFEDRSRKLGDGRCTCQGSHLSLKYKGSRGSTSAVLVWKSDAGCPMSDVTEAGSWKTGAGSRKIGDGSWKLEDGCGDVESTTDEHTNAPILPNSLILQILIQTEAGSWKTGAAESCVQRLRQTLRIPAHPPARRLSVDEAPRQVGWRLGSRAATLTHWLETVYVSFRESRELLSRPDRLLYGFCH